MLPPSRPRSVVGAALALALAAACGGRDDGRPAPRTSAMIPDRAGPLIAFLGDSLTAGWHVDPKQAYPALIQEELRTRGVAVRVLNAGVSGDTTADGRRRLPRLLQEKPDIVVVALGANDGLRALPLAPMEENLRAILRDVKAAGARGLLVGMKIPPERDADYARRFEDVYATLAREHAWPLVPFLLEGVAGRAGLTFPDGVHPTAQGHQRMAATVLPAIWDLLRPAR